MTHDKSFRTHARIVVWRNKRLARLNQGIGRRTDSARVVVYRNSQGAKNSIRTPNGL